MLEKPPFHFIVGGLTMNLEQGDFCPKCGHIIVMPVDLTPECLCCGYDLQFHEEED
ncbi:MULTISPECIES: hypothetical protein [unclassified Vibrio]|uniref:hypothetical protein n=1 Tax=unclassified Vibrio TaxID=2614977 RepID=UPI0012E75DBB|nr:MULTISPECIES: hypothetical protein [unclassified Vibrio]